MNDATESEQPVQPPAPAAGPLVPRPAVTVIALMIAGVLVFNIVWDSTHQAYDGSKTTLVLSLLIFTTFGVDVGKWLRR